MAKARHVGTPHLPQFVFGKSLKICIPVSAIEVVSLCRNNLVSNIKIQV
jgi:hypothetical protein